MAIPDQAEPGNGLDLRVLVWPTSIQVQLVGAIGQLIGGVAACR